MIMHTSRRIIPAALIVLIVTVAALFMDDRRSDPPPAEAAGPIAVRALAPDIIDFIIDGDGGPNSVNLIQPIDGLNIVEVFLPGDQTSSLGGNVDFYPDYTETALLEAFGASDTPVGPPQMNLTAGQASTPGLAGKLTIAGHIGRPATHGGSFSGHAETGRVTFGASQAGFIYHEARIATAAPHGMGPVDPTFATVTCGSIFSFVAGTDPFTGAGKADFADGDCDGVIHGPMIYNQPQAAIGSCMANYLAGPSIPNDPTCREDSLVLAHLMASSLSSPVGVTTATYTQAAAPNAALNGIGAPTLGGTGGAPFEVLGDPTGFLVLQNPNCNAGAVGTCVPDALSTGNAGPGECQPQPAMDMGNGAVAFTWDQVDNTDLTLATAVYAPTTASGRRVTRHRMTWDSDNDNVAHPQESFTVSFNAPIALPYPLEGVIGIDLLCSGSAAGTANVTVTTGAVNAVFPVTSSQVTSLRLDMNITNGNGVCDPIDSSASVPVGAAALKVAVCLINPQGTMPVAAFGYNVRYNDTLIVAPEVADVAPALDDNPDANVGATTFTSATYPNHLGGGWACDGGVGAFPRGDDNAATGANNGNAYSGGCFSGAGPNTLIRGPLGVITFDTLGPGTDTLTFGGSSVTAEDLSEIGSCNQPGDAPMPCVGGSVTIGGCPAVPNNDGESRPNGENIAGDDATWPNHDSNGNACDTDDDNDGLLDTDEISGTACAGTQTDPSDLDTDGDRLLDGWECANGSNPASASSKALGSGAGDVDGDNIPDLWERRGYNGSGGVQDSDSDACWDMVEIASIDGNRTVGDADRLAVARRALNIAPFNVPYEEQDFVLDIDHNGTVGDPDRLLVARAALLGPPWMPKSCP